MNKTTVLVSLLTSLSLSLLNATPLYWDANGDSPDFGSASGIWGVDTNWSADDSGATVPDTLNTTATDTLYFGTTLLPLGAGTITVDGDTQAFHTMEFARRSGTITISGGTLNLAPQGSTIYINNGLATIGANLAGTGSLTKGGTYCYSHFLSDEPTIIASNLQLDQIIALTANWEALELTWNIASHWSSI